jgi:glycosyltransferase involved in cell wall biosynthesis
MAIERLTASLPQHAVGVSGVTADRLAEIGPAREDIEVVYNGVDVGHIQSIDPVRTSFDVLTVGRLVEAKRVETLLRAVGLLNGVRLGVVGDGPERDRLESLATDLGITDRVTFLGFLDEYDDVLARMRGTQVVASASVREGFGITLVEALAADCTVVAVEHPNSAGSEVVGDAGFLVEPTADSMADGLDRALSGARPATPPKERAREFDWDVIADRAEAVYRDVIADDQS